jgi:RNA polymerase sigma factor (sigma-70 family)
MSLGENVLLLYFKDLSKYPVLSKEEEKDLFKKSKSGDTAATEKIVLANLRLVIKFAAKYRKNIELLDAINCGNIGLFEAIENFDISKNYRFGTYAIWWIRKSIINYHYYHNDLIKQHFLYHKVQNFLKNFYNENQIHPTIEQISKKTKIHRKSIASVLDTSLKISLDSNIEEANATYHDIIHDKMKEEEKFESSIDFDHLLSHCRLTEREKDIIELHYGFSDVGEMKLSHISKMYKLSVERIRQIRNGALEKIRRYVENKPELYS